jgi:hypothetical protein
VTINTTQTVSGTFSSLYGQTTRYVVDAQGNISMATSFDHLGTSGPLDFSSIAKPEIAERAPIFGSVTETTTRTSAAVVEVAPGLVAVEGEFSTVATETKALIPLSSAGRGLVNVIGNPLTGGAITVGVNQLQGKYDGLTPRTLGSPERWMPHSVPGSARFPTSPVAPPASVPLRLSPRSVVP